jgi:anti-sigma B factor antagonist
MTFDAKMQVADGVATIHLAGELDTRSAPQFNDLIIDAARHELNQLVLIADKLTYMSSAGLRCLVFAHQKMPRAVQIMLIGAQPDVAEVIRLTGFDRSIIMQEAGELA